MKTLAETPAATSPAPDPKATALTRARYQRVAPFYDLMEILPERRYIPWRKRLWSMVRGAEILEVGVGTGKNMPHYPEDARVTAVDLTPGMLERAQRKARQLNLNNVELRLGDAQQLDFPGESFDTVVSTFVFCSVPNPVLGFRELKRVLKPGGRILMLEHMRSESPFLGAIMDLLNPLVVRMTGANINRRTLENIRLAGLKLEKAEDLALGGIFKLLVIKKDDING